MNDVAPAAVVWDTPDTACPTVHLADKLSLPLSCAARLAGAQIPESRVRVVAVGLGHVRKDAMELVLSADASIRDLGRGRSEISACTIVQGLPSMGKRIWIWANGQRVLIHEAELHALGVGVDELEVLLAMLQSMGDGVVIVIVTDSLTAWELCCGEKQPDGEEARVVELVQSKCCQPATAGVGRVTVTKPSRRPHMGPHSTSRVRQA